MNNNYVSYDYKDVNTGREHMSVYLDGYASFGWVQDDNMPRRQTSIKLKRERKIINKVELTRLERNFEACMSEIVALESAKTATPTLYSLTIAMAGTAFMAGSVFAVTHPVPNIPLTIILGLPGILGWILPPLLHKRFVRRAVKKLTPLIEAKYDELYEVCEKGNRLLK